MSVNGGMVVGTNPETVVRMGQRWPEHWWCGAHHLAKVSFKSGPDTIATSIEADGLGSIGTTVSLLDLEIVSVPETLVK